MPIRSVIKFEGDNNTFICKYSGEDFNNGSRLVVGESQEAIFMAEGKIVGRYKKPGTYSLNTRNNPFLAPFRNMIYGGESPYNYKIYFINKVSQLGIEWGLPSHVRYHDSVNDYYFEIGASGSMAVRVEDGEKLLLTLVGNGRSFTQSHLQDLFREKSIGTISSNLSNELSYMGVNILEIDKKKGELSCAIKEELNPVFEEYGVELIEFSISEIIKPENDLYYEKVIKISGLRNIDPKIEEGQQNIELIRATTEKYKAVIEAEGRAKIIQTIGEDNYFKEKAYEIMSELAKNQGTGADMRNNLMGVAQGFGMATPLGRALGDIAAQTMSGIKNGNGFSGTNSADNQWRQRYIRPKETGGSKPLSETAVNNQDTIQTRINKLQELKNSGLCSDEEFEIKRKEILNSI